MSMPTASNAASQFPTAIAHTMVGGAHADSSTTKVTESSVTRSYLTAAWHLRQLGHTSAPEDDPVNEVIRTLMGLPGVLAVSHFHRADAERFTASTPLICRKSLAEMARTWEPFLLDAVSHAVQTGKTYSQDLPGQPYRVTCAPIGAVAHPTGVIGIFSDVREISEIPIMLFAQLVSAELAPASGALPTVNGPLATLLAETHVRDSMETRFEKLASAIQHHFSVAHVFLGLRQRSGTLKLQAASGVEHVVRSTPLAVVIRDVMAESTLFGTTKLCEAGNKQHLTHAEWRLCRELDAVRLITGPLCDAEGELVGAWILADDGKSTLPAHALSLKESAQRIAPWVASTLHLLQLANASPWSRAAQFLHESLVGRKGKRTVILAALIVASLWVPLPYQIRCNCETQPSTRRFVSAPYDGQLNEVLVRPGDVVQVHQVLARMDRREIEWKLAAHEAEYKRASKLHDASMAARDTSAAQLARLEMERCDAERKLLENRLRHLEITSPIDGIVLTGDPKQLEGARLTVGQTLFETGPLYPMLVEVQVPEAEIMHVQVGDHVRIRLDALPTRKFEGAIERLAPRAEARDAKNVFLAEVSLENSDLTIRPGMKGRGRIVGQSHALGWNLFHKPLTYFLRWIGW